MIVDIDALRDYGMDIRLTHGVRGGYYLAGQMFELSELEGLSGVLPYGTLRTEGG